MYNLPKKYCEECQSSAEFNHCYLNSGCESIDEFCKTECVHSSHFIKIFGKRNSNRIKRKLGLIK